MTYLNGTKVTSPETGGGGCPYQYEWCRNTPQLAFPQLISAATLVAIGYPLAAVILSALYSQVIGPFAQVFRIKCYFLSSNCSDSG